MIIPNESKIIELLEEVRKKPNTTLTNQHFSSAQWLQYNVEKECFEYEDGVVLGYSPSQVIELFNELILKGYGDWLLTAEWKIKL